jgi:hypothetical protein
VTAQRHPVDFLSGWHPAEVVDGVRPEVWRWSAGAGTLEFVTPDEDLTLHLDLDQPVTLPEAQTVRLRLGDAVLDEFSPPPGERVWRQVPLPAAAFDDAVVQQFVVEVNRTFVPAILGVGDDTRELGIRVFHAVLLAE